MNFGIVGTFLDDELQEEKYEIFDSGMFNGICKGYLLMALDDADVDPATRAKAVSALREAFEFTGSEEAEKYGQDH